MAQCGHTFVYRVKRPGGTHVPESDKIAFYRQQARDLRQMSKRAAKAEFQNELEELAVKYDLLAASYERKKKQP